MQNHCIVAQFALTQCTTSMFVAALAANVTWSHVIMLSVLHPILLKQSAPRIAFISAAAAVISGAGADGTATAHLCLHGKTDRSSHAAPSSRVLGFAGLSAKTAKAQLARHGCFGHPLQSADPSVASAQRPFSAAALQHRDPVIF